MDNRMEELYEYVEGFIGRRGIESVDDIDGTDYDGMSNFIYDCVEIVLGER